MPMSSAGAAAARYAPAGMPGPASAAAATTTAALATKPWMHQPSSFLSAVYRDVPALPADHPGHDRDHREQHRAEQGMPVRQEQGLQAQPDQDAQADQGGVSEPDDTGHLATQQRRRAGRDRGLRRDPHPAGPGRVVVAVRVMPGRRVGPVRSAAGPGRRARGHRPFAGVDAADLGGDGHRAAARHDPVDGLLLPEGVAGLGLAGHVGPAAGEADRGAERLASLAGVEPVGRREQLLDRLRGPLGYVIPGAGDRRLGLGVRRPLGLRGALRPRRGGAGRCAGALLADRAGAVLGGRGDAEPAARAGEGSRPGGRSWPVSGAPVSSWAVLGCAVLGCAVLGCAVFGCAVFGCAVFGCAVFGCAVFGCAVFGCAVFGCAVFGCAVLGCAVFGWAVRAAGLARRLLFLFFLVGGISSLPGWPHRCR